MLKFTLKQIYSEALAFTQIAKILAKNAKYLVAEKPKTIQTSVCFIFRVNPWFSRVSASGLAQPGDLNQVYEDCFKYDSAQKTEQKPNLSFPHFLEFLIVKRAPNPQDTRHFGQFAFPGGHLNKGETDLEASQRECMEEVGLDLKDPERFGFVGKFPFNTFAYYRHGMPTYISTNVYFQKPISELEMTLCPKEIAKSVWVPLSWFYHHEESREIALERDPTQ
jgi:8-oxo-dGTP pyrophosphatase MutT (NUDIX family)